jgi:hypothetical protein
MYRMGIAWVLLVATGSLALGEDRSPEKLIQQLSDKSFKVRQAAARAIEDLGPQALPALRQALNHPDLEVRRRIQKWIPEFEARALVAAKKVTLNMKDQPVSKILEELSRQTGYKIELDSRARVPKSCTVQINQGTFWEALDKICLEAGLAPSRFPAAADALVLEPAETGSPLVMYHHAFRVAAVALQYDKSSMSTVLRRIELGKARPERGVSAPRAQTQTSESETLYVEFTLAAEPRLSILGIGKPDLTEALDDQNHSLIPQQEKDSLGMREMDFRLPVRIGRFGLAMDSGHISLRPPAKDTHSLKMVRGTIPVYLAKDKKTTVLYADLKNAQGKKIELGGATYQLDLFHQSAKRDRFEVFLTVSGQKEVPFGQLGQPKPFFNRAHMADESGEIELQDAKGNSYLATGSSSGGDGQTTEMRLSYSGPRPFNQAAALGPPAKLVHVKLERQVYHVPFEFNDLPLP